MKSKPVSVLVPLKALEKSAVETIKGLEKKIRTLEQKLARREKRIVDLEEGMDLTKDRRKHVRELATALFNALGEADWIDVDDYYEGEL